MTAAGWARPPLPMTVGVMIVPGAWVQGVTVSVCTAASWAISVMVRLSALPPGRNSDTVPLTCTASPTVRAPRIAALVVKTKMPSEVAGLLSGEGSCR
jgi:hypothetical protein